MTSLHTLTRRLSAMSISRPSCAVRTSASISSSGRIRRPLTQQHRGVYSYVYPNSVSSLLPDVNGHQQTRSFARRAAAAGREDGSAEPRKRAPQITSDEIPPAFLRRLPRKPAPSVVRKRVAKLRTYVGTEKDIRHSPWRLNLICQFAAGQTVPEALTQLQYVRKSRAPLVRKVINSTVKQAVEKDGVHPTQLEVAECFATHGKHIKRMKTMGRGRAGIMHHRFSHVRVVLREIDFPLKIALCNSVAGKRKWLEKMKIAEREGEGARLEREEVERLEKRIEERKKAKEDTE
mmetsp:Transcript_13137/g.28516  ORF Transcript_13137/g.28516 Transcript_13137/m.28516 type:complete len:291 (+) Transcript_13137:128-1000(+)